MCIYISMSKFFYSISVTLQLTPIFQWLPTGLREAVPLQLGYEKPCSQQTKLTWSYNAGYHPLIVPWHTAWLNVFGPLMFVPAFANKTNAWGVGGSVAMWWKERAQTQGLAGISRNAGGASAKASMRWSKILALQWVRWKEKVWGTAM